VGDLKYPLVSDIKREISQKYQVLNSDGVALRGLFIIDKEVTTQWLCQFPSNAKALCFKANLPPCCAVLGGQAYLSKAVRRSTPRFPLCDWHTTTPPPLATNLVEIVQNQQSPTPPSAVKDQNRRSLPGPAGYHPARHDQQHGVWAERGRDHQDAAGHPVCAGEPRRGVPGRLEAG